MQLGHNTRKLVLATSKHGTRSWIVETSAIRASMSSLAVWSIFRVKLRGLKIILPGELEQNALRRPYSQSCQGSFMGTPTPVGRAQCVCT